MKLANPASLLIRFLKEVQLEARRVNWPTRERVIRDTFVVIVFSAAVAAFLSLFDFLFKKLLGLII
ncbi:preprotein translocase subunit SecE [Patescibacteria group bacterium]|nr:preprotein translocase subunit SecE [Patescibacteria group bacterium]